MNENFINIWVSNVELGRTPNKQDFITLRREHGFRLFDTANPLAQAIMKGWKKNSPSDSLVISSEFELMGRQPVNELPGANKAQYYLTFLKEALAGHLPGFGGEIPELQPEKPESQKESSVLPRQSAEDAMNAYVQAFKNLDAEVMRSMLTGHARETFEMDAENLTEDMRTMLSQILSHMKVLNSEYVDDEFHFQLRVPGSTPPEISVKMRKEEGVWLVYDVE